jgi:riboflavin-specific deaminase-like protein
MEGIIGVLHDLKMADRSRYRTGRRTARSGAISGHAERAQLRQLFPLAAEDVDPLELYDRGDRRPPSHRPYVLVNMVASVDGATSVDGLTRALGSPTDRMIFLHLRDLADAVLVGAATVRAERYGPIRTDPSERERRKRRGQKPRPAIVVVSRSLDFDWESPFFTDADPKPLILAPADTQPERLKRVRHRADVLATGQATVDLTDALSQLRGQGVELLLCEGGPMLNTELIRAGLIDEICLTVAPLLASGGPRGIFGAGLTQDLVNLRLVHLLEDNGFLFHRYLISRAETASTTP